MYCVNAKKLEIASAYAAIGMKVLPNHVAKDGVCSCFKGLECPSPGKHPATKHGFQDGTDDPEKIKEFFGDESKNIGVATGEMSGVWVLDEDDDGSAVKKLEEKYGVLPPTWTVKTGGGGRQRYFRFTDAVSKKKNAVKFLPGLDIRTTGGQAVLPPSLHKSGNRYEWIIPPDSMEVAEAPQWLLDLIPDREETKKKVGPGPVKIDKAKTLAERAVLYLEAAPVAVAGQNGHGQTFAVCCRLCELFGELTEDELFDLMEDWNDRCDPPWSESDLRRKIAQAKKKIPEATDLDDDGGDVPDWKPVLSPECYHGIVGEYLRKLEPVTECDSAALLMTFLASIGVAVGRNPHFRVEGTNHYANLFSVTVGPSSRGRKGTSLGRNKEVMHDSMPPVASGLSTGEGLINAVRDGAGEDPGITDKRLLVIEGEFSRCLKVMKRESNTLSTILRDAWDSGNLSVLTRNNPLTATDAHIGIVTHITMHELEKTLQDVDVYNGFGNRFLWSCSERAKWLPDTDDVDLTAIRAKLQGTIEVAKQIGRMTRSPEAAELWRQVYRDLGEEKESVVWDAVTSRAEAQVVRLSMIYALLDGASTIEVTHLKAALAVWDYCDQSARYLFADASVESLDSRILKIVQKEPGIMKSVCRKRFGHGTNMGKKFEIALNKLLRAKKVIAVTIMDARQAEVLYPGPTSLSPLNPESPQVKKDVMPRQEPEAKYLSPLSPESSPEKKSEGPTPATITELFEWRNSNKITFERRREGEIWVTPSDESKLTPAIEAAIRANQQTLAMLLPPVAEPKQIAPEDEEMSEEEFMAEMNALL